MPVTAAQLIEYGVANRPEDDVSSYGGAIDTAARPLAIELAAATQLEALSDGADTRTITVRGRLANGTEDTDSVSLNGTTPVTLPPTFERILEAFLSTTSGTRTVTLRVISGGAVQHTFNPNETHAFRMFNKAVSGPSQKVYYEATDRKNTNSEPASLLGAIVDLTADPSSKIEIGLSTAVNPTTSISNRLTAPAGVTFVDDNVDQAVPGGDLAGGDHVRVWRRFTLAANNVALKTTHTTRIRGSTA